MGRKLSVFRSFNLDFLQANITVSKIILYDYFRKDIKFLS